MAKHAALSLAGQRVLVTGAADGIGRAAARAFRAEGARVAMLDIQAQALEAAREELAAAPTGAAADRPRSQVTASTAAAAEPLAVVADVSRDGDLEAAVERVLEAFGRIDVLVNNAGLVMGGRFEEGDPARMRRLLEVNLYGPLRLTQLVLPHMREQGSGHILNVISSGAVLAVPGYAVYSASKTGLIGFTRVLRRELRGSGIHVTLFCPGSTATAMTRASLAFGKGTAEQPHHGPERPAAAMVEAVRNPRAVVLVSAKPRMQAVATWLDKLFPHLMDSYWEKHADADHYESAALSGK